MPYAIRNHWLLLKKFLFLFWYPHIYVYICILSSFLAANLIKWEYYTVSSASFASMSSGIDRLSHIYSTMYCLQVSIHVVTYEGRKYNHLVMKGAPERILAVCSSIMLEGHTVDMNDKLRAAFQRANDDLGGIGERVLGFADFPLPLNDFPLDFKFNAEDINFPLTNLRFIGLISLIDPPRPNVPEAVLKCRSAGIKVLIVSHSHKSFRNK